MPLLRTGPLLLRGRGLRSDQRRAEAQAGASIVRLIHARLTNPRRSGDSLLVLRTRSATVVGSVPGPAVWGTQCGMRQPLPAALHNPQKAGAGRGRPTHLRSGPPRPIASPLPIPHGPPSNSRDKPASTQ